MKQKKKNKFAAFLWSFMPGAAEMYMGFMKNGLSIMAIFFLSILIPSVLYISDAFILPTFLIWFYGFFHARNLYACEDETFEQLDDIWVWEEFLDGRSFRMTNFRISSRAARKWCAYILIVCGAVLLWKNCSSAIYSLFYSLLPYYLSDAMYCAMEKIPQIVISFLLIVVGLRMVKGKKEELEREEEILEWDVIEGKQEKVYRQEEKYDVCKEEQPDEQSNEQ